MNRPALVYRVPLTIMSIGLAISFGAMVLALLTRGTWELAFDATCVVTQTALVFGYRAFIERCLRETPLPHIDLYINGVKLQAVEVDDHPPEVAH